ncbi:hypothetical protein [Paenibacillus germinis]|nr:hypothetical protein [Paenibacillus germinis]
MTNNRETTIESTVNAEGKSDDFNEDGPDDTVIRSSEHTSPETCRAGFDD